LSHSRQKPASIHRKPRVGELIGEERVATVKREMRVEFFGGDERAVRD
jgi:hypothetical protein